jgi:hypothetical protein
MGLRERPRNTLRFDAPRKGEFGYERRKLFQDLIHTALKRPELFPELIGATGFGSVMTRAAKVDRFSKPVLERKKFLFGLIKWIRHTGTYEYRIMPLKSDIDAYVFIDPEKNPVLKSEMIRARELMPDVYVDWSPLIFTEKLQAGYRRHLLTPLYEQLHDMVRDAYPHFRPPEVREHAARMIHDISILPMSYPIIDEWMDRFREVLAQAGGDAAAREQAMQSNATPANYASMLFAARIGPGIVAYRTYFLEGLHAMGPDGELIWRQIMRGLKQWEHGREPGASQRPYPETLDQAMRIYARSERPAETERSDDSPQGADEL